MSGFSNPIIGGGGGLVYPSIHSPDFNESAGTGWAILKNGDAFFFNLTASGTITGGDIVITGADGGLFVYELVPV